MNTKPEPLRRTTRLIARWLVALACVAGPLVPGALAVTAELERARINAGETVRLRVSVQDGASGGQPDFSVLQQDFELLGTSRSSQVSIINGRMEQRTGWTITLMPRRTGTLTVPPIPVGAEQTDALALEVRPEEAAATGEADNLFLEASADVPEPYVGAQVIYTQRLYFRELADGRLEPLEVQGARVQRVGEDRTFTTERDGRRYRVLERRYGVFPREAGPLSLPAPVFRGRVPDAGGGPRAPLGGIAPFDQLFQPTRGVVLRGEPLELQVRPRPEGVTGPWLPAEEVSLEEAWSVSGDRITAGEPVTRTVTLVARGQDGPALPDLREPRVPGFRVYPDPPHKETVVRDGDLVGRRIESYALVAPEAGEVTVPALSVAWWDTVQGRERVARLPERRFRVQPAPVGANGDTSSRERPAAAPAPAPREPAPTPETGPVIWPWLVMGLVLAWGVTVGLWLRERRRRGAPAGSTGVGVAAAPGVADDYLADIRSACANGHPRAARDALLTWAQARWPEAPPRNLMALAERLGDSAARDCLAALDRAIYAGEADAWQGDKAWETLRPLLSLGGAAGRAGAKAPVLPDLYPRYDLLRPAARGSRRR